MLYKFPIIIIILAATSFVVDAIAFFLKSEIRMTASVLKQEPNT